MKVIGVIGAIGAGKNYCINKLIELDKANGEQVAILSYFADEKRFFAKRGWYKTYRVGSNPISVGLDDFLVFSKQYQELRDEINLAHRATKNEYPQYFRRVMQLMGDCTKDVLGQDVYADAMVQRIKLLEETKIITKVYIDDMRFFYEFKALKLAKLNLDIVEIIASTETCATRRGVSLDEYAKMREHNSEKDAEYISIVAKTMGILVQINNEVVL